MTTPKHPRSPQRQADPPDNLVDPFLKRLQEGGQPPKINSVSLFTFGGEQLINSPRSLYACKASGFGPEDLIPLSNDALEDLAGTKELRERRREQWEAKRPDRIAKCIAKYKELQAAAEEAHKNAGKDITELALQRRERQQQEKNDRLKMAKQRMLLKMIDDQLAREEAKAKAHEKLQHKEHEVHARREEKQRRQEEESLRRSMEMERRRAAVQAATEEAIEQRKKRRELKEEQVLAQQHQQQKQREEAALKCQERQEQKREEMARKREKCIAEERERVVKLLEKRKAVEEQQKILLEKRDRQLQDKADALALRNLAIQDHVRQSAKVQEAEKEQALKRFEEKRRRADRLTALKKKIVEGQQRINTEDRENRLRLQHWKAATQITGDLALPDWLKEEIDEDKLSTRTLSPSNPKRHRNKVADCLVHIPDKQYHAKWVFD